MTEIAPAGRTAVLERPTAQSGGSGLSEADRARLAAIKQAVSQAVGPGVPVGGGGTPPEGPRAPEPTFGPEWEASPERGRAVAREIIRLETTLSYDERYKVKIGDLSTSNPEIYSEKNGTYLDQLYKDLQAYVVMICQKRGEEDPFDPRKVYEEIKEAMRAEAEGSPPKEESEKETNQREADEAYLSSKTAAEHKLEIANLKVKSESDDTLPEDRAEIEEKLLIYFRAAKRKNLLLGADKILESVYQTHVIGMPSNRPEDEEMAPAAKPLYETVRLVNEAVEQATTASQAVYRLLREDPEFATANPELVWLKDVYEPYITRAKQRIERFMYGFAQPEYKQGEFEPEADRQTVGRMGRETYWRPSSWASYYTITATNPEQFRTAVDTFLQMVRTGSIGKSPDDLYQDLINFKKALGAAGAVQERRGAITHEELEELRVEFEGISYAFGADYNNEDYNPEGFYKYMQAMTKDEGPERWIGLARSRGGQVAYDLKWFDRVSQQAVSTLLHNACGSRGQIGNDTITQHFLQDQIKEIQIEKSMGVMIKDYNPKDTNPNSPVKLSNSRVAEAKRRVYRKKNLGRIGLHITDEEFAALYEGFDKGDAHINNYLRFVDYDQSKFPKSLKDSIELGRVQLLVQKLDLETVARLKISVPGEAFPGLSEKDRVIYKEAYDQAKTSFDIAFQMVGISCEKVRRGGGIFYVDRNVRFQAYQRVRTKELDRIHQQIENDIKSGSIKDKNRKKKAVNNLTKNEQELYENKDSDAYYRKLSLKEKGALWSQSEWLGWLISEIRDGRKLDAFSKEEQDFYHGLGTIDKNGQFHKAPVSADGTVIPTVTDADRKDYVDHMPIFLAENFVQFADTWTKIKYADDAEIWNGPEFAKHLSDISKDADIWKDPKLAKQLEGMLQDASLQSTPLKDVPNFKAMYRTAMSTKARRVAVSEIKNNGFQARLLDADYNINGQLLGSFRLMTLKTPTLQAEGTYGPFSTREVPVDFQTAVSHIYSRWTSHTYWGYQNENRHYLLAPHIFEQARQIRAGLLPPEKADLLATQLLIIDPTLKRVASLAGDQEQREISLMQAAVEGSLQGHWRINRELCEAFLPKDGNPDKMRLGFNMEDWGGQSRFVIQIKALAASQPKRFSRRLSAMIAEMPMEVSSMPAIWGQEGVMGAIEMFADPIGKIAHQKVVSKLGINKFVDQMYYGWMLFGALVGYVDKEKGISIEGLFEKPTNNADKLWLFYEKLSQIGEHPDKLNEILYGLKESLGRLERVMQLMRTMGTDARNSQGALFLEDKDIFLPDGSYNTKIAFDKNTGTSRHSQRILFDTYMDWLLSRETGGGVESYQSEAYYYKLLNKPITWFDTESQEHRTGTLKDWLFDKMGR
ncbi:hypothetical protein A3D83_01940 [Candidatus Daviesbacteria bacterium RIFCSPHIGHO2_02_FULL_41_10]|uniref:Uncharacterized protein n=2 Tax=Candidatus Daviesiibacteriota TaxID=1752718 RepID=A0A1F5IQS9_9BACT|nr:MAG: hypothetical protein A2871_04190 [Candidatus Daviesbacteria bacterium RIFCSPHIGHO2_01_FULL_41_23]OGE32387.1 MAG: hypothetical protein A3D83_01940 [Candidatus Daviesbacteria bacterium RIFCSPHIGHO2_02_FULL_41_10]OGE62260.1 MAG: hypothetical protein A2967_02280 [Candidatus Daviesbacteria bacterium RIFCSPLOWO2_01_FULL_41_32]